MSNEATAPVDQLQPCCSSTVDNSFEMPSSSDEISLTSAKKAKECEAQHNHQSFDIPSRALLEAVRSTFDDRRKFRLSHQKTLNLVKSEENDRREEEEEGTTPIVDQKAIVTAKSKEESSSDLVEVTTTPKKKSFRDVSCSPIQFSTIQLEFNIGSSSGEVKLL